MSFLAGILSIRKVVQSNRRDSIALTTVSSGAIALSMKYFS